MDGHSETDKTTERKFCLLHAYTTTTSIWVFITARKRVYPFLPKKKKKIIAEADEKSLFFYILCTPNKYNIPRIYLDSPHRL